MKCSCPAFAYARAVILQEYPAPNKEHQPELELVRNVLGPTPDLLNQKCGNGALGLPL